MSILVLFVSGDGSTFNDKSSLLHSVYVLVDSSIYSRVRSLRKVTSFHPHVTPYVISSRFLFTHVSLEEVSSL